jgi:hypothetical protein
MTLGVGIRPARMSMAFLSPPPLTAAEQRALLAVSDG